MAGRQRIEFTHLLILFSFFIFGQEAFGQAKDRPQLVDRGPYLQRMTPSSVIIKWWVSTADIANNTIHYGTSPGSLSSSIPDGSFTSRSVCSSSNCDDFYEFQVTLNSLSSDTRYYYAVGTSTTPSTEETANGTFKTFPASGAKPTRVWVIGDSGTKSSQALLVKERFQNYTQTRNPDVWIMLGNNAYSSGSNRDHGDAVFFMYPDFLKNVAVWPAIGERDDNNINTYNTIFVLPNNAQSGGVASGTEAYYSYDYGNTHFIVLDVSNTSLSNGGAMQNWLQNDLNANSKEWTIAYFHASPYSKGWDDSDSGSRANDIRNNFVDILEQAGVDLVLTANSHAYERSFLIDGHYGTSGTFSPGTHIVDGGNGKSAPLPRADGAYHKNLVGGQPTANSGTVYAVVGSSGINQTNDEPLTRSYEEAAGPLNHPAMQFSVNRLGSMVIDVYENRLEAIFLNGFGDIADQFSITHGNSNIAPEIFNVSAAHPLTLEVQFSEPLDKASAENISNYSVNNGVTIFAAELLEDYRTVRLLTSQLDNSTEYILTATNIEDYETNTAIPAPGSDYSFTPHFVNPPIHTASFQDGYYPHRAYDGTKDTYVFEGEPNANFGTKAELISHGKFENEVDGDAVVLISWDLSSIPSNATIQSATVYLNLFNRSETSYHLRQILTSWSETNATWNSIGGLTNIGAAIMGTIIPEKFRLNTMPLTSDGINVVQGWVDGSISNYGLAVQNGGPGEDPDWWNAIRLFSRQTNARPRLSITYTLPSGADSISPAIIAPPDIVVDSTGTQTPVALGTAAAVDDNGVPAITNDAPAGGFPLGTTIVNWTATDGSGNTGTDTQLVTVRVPAATSPNTISFQDGVEPSAFYSGTEDSLLRKTSPNQNKGSDTEFWADGVSQDPEVALYGELASAIKWDLSAIPPNATVTSVEVSFNVFNDAPVNTNLYSILTPWTEENVTWNVAADPSVVGDDILGVISPFTFNENIVVLNQDGIDLVQGWVDGSIENNGFFIQIDGLNNNGIGIHSSEAGTLTSRPKITISYTVSGDTEPPVVTAPADITTPATGPLTPVNIGTATATDNVGVTSLTNNAPGGGFPAGVTVVTWTAMDAAGNIGTDNQTITVEDNVLPSITAPGDITTEATGPTTPVALGTPTTSDNVGVSSVTNDAPAEFPVGTTVVTWTVTDTSGNMNTDTQNVTVEDTTDPVVTAPGDITTTETGPLTPVDIGTATATDAVGVTSLTNDAPAGGFPQGTTIVTWTATDAAGNSGTDTQIIAVQAAGSGGPVTVSFQDGVEPDGTYAGTEDSLLRESSADSNYGNETSLSADLVQPDPSNGRFGEVISVISWDISSIPNNATVDSASISLNLTNISSGSYNLYQALTSWDESTVTWNSFGGSSTNVGAAVLGTIVPGQFNENVIVLTPDGISLIEGWIDGSIANHGIVIKEINNNNDGIFVDSSEAASNTNHPKLTITYNVAATGDTEPPVVTAPADITVESTGTLTPVDIGTATATDNVGVVSLTNDAPAGGYPIGTTIVTWTALDAAANVGTDTQSITVTEPTTTGVNVTSFQDGVEPNGTYSGTQDALLRQTSPDENNNTDELWADGVAPDPNNGKYGEVVSVVSWDISAIPSDAIVSSVTVTFDMFNDSSADHNILQATAPWSEDTVTWNSFGGTGSIGTTVLGTIGPFLYNEQEFILNSDGIALVQGWIDGSIANNGLVIQSAGTNNGIGWNSSEAATGRPKITITYLVGGGTLEFQDGVSPNNGYSGTRDAHVRQPFPDTNYGNDIVLFADNRKGGGPVDSLISWDLSSIPSSATVDSVSITINIINSSAGTYSFWQALNSWSEDTVTWNNFGSIGSSSLGTISSDSFGETTINLNSDGIALVQGWVDGSIGNNGVVLKSDGTNDGLDLNSREAASGRPKISVTITLP